MDRMAAPGTDGCQSSDLLLFGTFELDRSRQEWRRAGTLLKLQSQHLQLQALLVERARQVVTLGHDGKVNSGAGSWPHFN
jgi:DNA-binding response OmpR family regulator